MLINKISIGWTKQRGGQAFVKSKNQQINKRSWNEARSLPEN